MRFLIFPKIFENDHFFEFRNFQKSDTYLPLTLATPRRQRVHASSMLRATDHKSPKIHFFIFLANFQNDHFFLGSELQNGRRGRYFSMRLAAPRRGRAQASPMLRAAGHRSPKISKKIFFKIFENN